MNRYQKLFTKIIKSGSVWTYLLRDEFSDDRAAGSVNNTLATDGVNARTVIDSSNMISISSGKLNLLQSNANWHNISYPIQSRVAGKVVLVRTTIGTGVWGGQYGFASANGQNGTDSYGVKLENSGIMKANDIVVGAWLSGEYVIAVAMRAAGLFYFVNGVLRYISNAGTNNLYPLMAGQSSDGVRNVDSIRVASYWLPTPVVSDGFSNNGTSDGLGHAETSGIGSGGSGVVWSGTTWSVSGGKAINTPGLGSNVVVNGDFATDTVWTKGVGWTISSGTAHITSASTGNLTQTPLTVGAWYQSQFTVSNYITGYVRVMIGGSGEGTAFRSANGTQLGTGRCIGSATLLVQALDATLDVDNVSCKALALSDLLSLHTSFTPDVFTGIDITVVSGTQVGLSLNWDSSSSPANGVIAYHDGTNCKLEKCVAGTWTSVISAATTYSANAPLVISKIGTTYRLYYNNALVGSGTISNTSIINNTLHGRFSTDPGNTLDNYRCYASGTSGEYNILGSI